MKRRVWVWAGVALGAALFAVAAFIAAGRRAARPSVPIEEFRRAEAQAQELRGRVRNLEGELERMKQQPPPVAGPVPAPRTPQLPPGALEAIRSAATLQEKLRGAEAALRELHSRLGELEEQLERLRQENRSLAEQEQSAREALEGTRKLVEALRAEVKIKEERLEPLEASNRSLRRQKEEAEQRLLRSAQVLAELEEINRRREAYLASLLRRHRDLMEQQRTLAARLEGPGESPPAAGELSRMQNLIALAEEDLRQLQGLNARAQALHRQLR